MKPAYMQSCEICKSKPLILFDARIRLCQYGAKGHWMFLCPVCHYFWGLGYGYDDLIVYERMAGNFHEVKGGTIKMDEKELRGVVQKLFEDKEKDWNTLLLGEIAVQMTVLNGVLKDLTSYAASIEAHLQPTTEIVRSIQPEETFEDRDVVYRTEADSGS